MIFLLVNLCRCSPENSFAGWTLESGLKSLDIQSLSCHISRKRKYIEFEFRGLVTYTSNSLLKSYCMTFSVKYGALHIWFQSNLVNFEFPEDLNTVLGSSQPPYLKTGVEFTLTKNVPFSKISVKIQGTSDFGGIRTGDTLVTGQCSYQCTKNLKILFSYQITVFKSSTKSGNIFDFSISHSGL